MPQNFWNWFEKNIEVLNGFEPGMETVLDSISENLNIYNPKLAFEISQPNKDGVREFIISAEGVIDEFQSVIDLYESRPELEDWEILISSYTFQTIMPNNEIHL